MSIKKNKNQLIISIIIGLAVFAISYQFVMQQHEENIKQKAEIAKLKNGLTGLDKDEQDNSTIYIVAKKDIKKDDIITKDDIEKSDIGVKMGNAFKDANQVIGRKALQDIKKGNPVGKSFVETLDISSEDEPRLGFRAITATIAANRMGPFMREGAYIDVYTANDSVQAKNVRVVKILNPEGKGSKNVVLEIREEDVGPFVYAMTQDKIIPVQKNQSDRTSYEFSYDPFKYSSYTMDSTDLGELDSLEEPPIPSQRASTTKKTARSKKPKLQEYTGAVEVIRGNVTSVVDF